MVADAAHQHGADLHLHNGAEAVCFDDGVLAAVFAEHRPPAQRDGAHSMKQAGQEDVFPLDAAVNIGVAVVVVNAQAEHQRCAAGKARRQCVIAQQVAQRVAALLGRDDGVPLGGIDREQPVTGGDQNVGPHIDRPVFRADAAAEAVVEAAVWLVEILGQVDTVLFHKGAYERAREAAVHQPTGQTRKAAAGQRPQQQPAGRRPVQKSEEGRAVRPLSAAHRRNSSQRSSIMTINSTAPMPIRSRMPRVPGLRMRMGEMKAMPVSRATTK